MQRIYLDYSATTPVATDVLEAMLPFLKNDYGNASSIHSFGQKAREAVDRARDRVAQFLNCQSAEIIFTGSATEANNLAILGVVKAAQRKGIKNPHIITSKIEHPAVLEPCRILEKQGAEVSFLPVDKQGIVKVEDIKKAIKPNTVLISIIYANNEIGTIQPITDIAAAIARHPERSEGSPYPLFHTDAVQAVNYLNCDVQKSGVDLLTLSGHKIYGPKGVGALYVRQGAPIEPIIHGGHQERALRPGTENVAGIVGLGAAITLITKTGSNLCDRRDLKRPAHEKLKVLRDKLINGILEKIPQSRLNGSRENRLPNNVNVSFEGAEGEAIVMALDQEGIAASTGSACSSGSLAPSHVLLALGLSELRAHGSLRLTLGRYTTEQEIDRVLEVLSKVIKRLRSISGRSVEV